MVHLQMNGYIADNLYQYTIARVIAEELGYALKFSHSRMHPQRNVPQLEAFLAACPNAPLELAGAIHEGPVDYSSHVDHGDFDGYDLDLAGIFARSDPRRIEVRGNFQRYALLQPYKGRIRAWFAMEPCDQGYEVSPDDLVLHVRRGDFVVFDSAMSLNFYIDLLERLTYRRLYIVGCGLDGEVRRRFAPYAPVYIEGEPVDDFKFMLAFNRMILSNSGFSWWAGFLSAAREVHVPLMDKNPRADELKGTKPDLRIQDEPRFLYVENVPYMERGYTLRDIFRSRGQLTKRRMVSAVQSLLARRLGMRG
ncbi:MAG: hypothetical protein ACJAYC_000490 [Halieaceae bacterium]|jgi:hypothetical protein